MKGYNIGFKKVKEEKGESSGWIEGVGSEKKKWDLRVYKYNVYTAEVNGVGGR